MLERSYSTVSRTTFNRSPQIEHSVGGSPTKQTQYRKSLGRNAACDTELADGKSVSPQRLQQHHIGDNMLDEDSLICG